VISRGGGNFKMGEIKYDCIVETDCLLSKLFCLKINCNIFLNRIEYLLLLKWRDSLVI